MGYSTSLFTVNDMGDTGATALSEALKINSSLVKLELWGKHHIHQTLIKAFVSWFVE